MRFLKAGLLVCFFASCHWISAHVDQTPIIPISQLSEADIAAFYEGETNPIILEFTEGLQMPVNFFLGGDLVQLQGNGDWTINIQRTFFLKHVEAGFLFSLDQNHWATLSEFITGNMTAELNVRDSKPRFIFGAEINPRTSD